jgi:CBS-domain-containing membrane protein
MKNWTVDDVMTAAVVSVDASATYRDMVDLLMSRHFSAMPVIDPSRRVIGLVSEADLLCKIEFAGDEEPRLFERARRRDQRAKAAGRTAADLMSAPPVVVRSGTSIAAAARLLDQKRVKRLPVVDADGRLVGIVSRGDLLKAHLRSDDDLLAAIEDEVLRPYLADDANDVHVRVDDGVVTVTGQTDRWSDGDLAVRLIRRVDGVVDVLSTLEFTFDDRQLPEPSRLYGVAERRR